MKTQLQTNNPFGPIPKGLVLELVKAYNPKKHLDYGANDGQLISAISKHTQAEKIIGVDLNADVVKLNQSIMPENVELLSITKNPRLKFEDAYFESISIVGVLEHIYDQDTILAELKRVLDDKGHLIVAVPGKHLFSFLDMGNWKFVFPRAHKLAFIYFNSKEEYQKRYIECRNGMFGDIEVEKMWHEHFSKKDLKNLLERHGFQIIFEDGLGFFQRIFANAAYFLPSGLKRILNKIIDWDAKAFESTELVIVAKKA